MQNHPLLLHLPHLGGSSSSTAFSEDSKTGSDPSDQDDTDSEDRLSLDDLNLWDLTANSTSSKAKVKVSTLVNSGTRLRAPHFLFGRQPQLGRKKTVKYKTSTSNSH